MAFNNDIISIDLGTIGLDGTLLMNRPGHTREAQLKNEITKISSVNTDGGKPAASIPPLGDLETLEVLAYVKEAPFPLTLQSFYNYCDGIDEDNPGVSNTLFKLMSDAKEALCKGAKSPLDL